MSALVHGREEPDQPGPRRRVHHRDVELAVGRIGVGTHQHSAAVAAGVAESREREVGDDLLAAVEHQPEGQQPQLGEFGEHREVVAHPAARPPHPVGPVGDQRIESCGCDRAEPLGGAAAIPNASQVDGFGPAVGDDVGGGHRIFCRQTEFARMVVAGAGGDDAQRNVGARQRLQRVGDHPVAADDHQCVGPVVECCVQQSARVVGIAADDGHHVDAALLQSRDRHTGGVRGIAMS